MTLSAWKAKAYKNGDYSFEPPPVCTAQWDAEAWIAYIDQHGEWHGDGTAPPEPNQGSPIVYTNNKGKRYDAIFLCSFSEDERENAVAGTWAIRIAGEPYGKLVHWSRVALLY